MSPTRTATSPRRRRTLLGVAALGLLLLACTGCTLNEIAFLDVPSAVTDQGRVAGNLWRGAWIAAWIVGIFMWGLMIWSMIRYRKRSEELPSQTQYNVPIEVLYTVIPFVIIGVLFYFTVRDQTQINKLSSNPDVRVEVVGFQWSWQFNYVDQGVSVVGRPGNFPQLVIPTGQTIRFELRSPDVIHSFWVPEFLFKRDVIPGRDNRFEVTADKQGTYVGKCAEFCGLDHSRMLFTVKVVSPQQFDQFIANAKAGRQPTGGGIVTTTAGSAS